MSEHEPDYAAKLCKCGAPACVMHWFSMLGGHGYAVQCMALHTGPWAKTVLGAKRLWTTAQNEPARQT